MKRCLVIVGLFALVGCGGSDSTGPIAANVAGSWSYAVTNLTGSGFTCNASGTTLVLNQAGPTFSGTYSGGTLNCSAPGTPPQSFAVGQGIVVTGNVGATNVSFNLDTSDWTNTGTISGDSMSGTTHVTISDGTTTINLDGNFAAARQ